jgi:predicted transcriptional regulator
MNVTLNIDVFHLVYAKGLPMPKKLIEIASEIVQTQVSLTPMSAADIAASLRQVFSTLHELQRGESGEIELPKIQEPAPAKAIKPEDSIQNDKVICLECGAECRQLTGKHLVSHGMSQKEYRKKYGFAMRTPLSAKSLTRARSKAAKKRGLPEKLQKYIEARKQKKAAKSKASKPAVTEKVTAGKPKRTRLRKKKAV